MSDKITIPDELQDVCRKIAALARQSGLQQLSCEIWPSWKSQWRDKIHMTWEQGRHGADSGKIRLSSQVWVNADIEPVIDAPPEATP